MGNYMRTCKRPIWRIPIVPKYIKRLCSIPCCQSVSARLTRLLVSKKVNVYSIRVRIDGKNGTCSIRVVICIVVYVVNPTIPYKIDVVWVEILVEESKRFPHLLRRLSSRSVASSDNVDINSKEVRAGRVAKVAVTTQVADGAGVGHGVTKCLGLGFGALITYHKPK